MGYFSELHIDIVDMFHLEGMKETEIAVSLGIPLIMVHDALAAHEESSDFHATDDNDIVVSYDDLVLEPNDENYNQEDKT